MSAQKKKYVSLIFMSTTTYQKIIKIGEVGLGWFPCKFNSEPNIELTELKRFGCLAYIKVQRKTGSKFDQLGRRVMLQGYHGTGYLLLKTEGKIL